MEKSIADRILDETRERLTSRHDIEHLAKQGEEPAPAHTTPTGVEQELADLIMKKIKSELLPLVKEVVATEIQANVRSLQQDLQEMARHLTPTQQPHAEHSTPRQPANSSEKETLEPEKTLGVSSTVESPMDDLRQQLDQILVEDASPNQFAIGLIDVDEAWKSTGPDQAQEKQPEETTTDSFTSKTEKISITGSPKDETETRVRSRAKTDPENDGASDTDTTLLPAIENERINVEYEPATEPDTTASGILTPKAAPEKTQEKLSGKEEHDDSDSHPPSSGDEKFPPRVDTDGSEGPVDKLEAATPDNYLTEREVIAALDRQETTRVLPRRGLDVKKNGEADSSKVSEKAKEARSSDGTALTDGKGFDAESKKIEELENMVQSIEDSQQRIMVMLENMQSTYSRKAKSVIKNLNPTEGEK